MYIYVYIYRQRETDRKRKKIGSLEDGGENVAARDKRREFYINFPKGLKMRQWDRERESEITREWERDRERVIKDGICFRTFGHLVEMNKLIIRNTIRNGTISYLNN